jgi:hypothetical protein
MAADADGGVGGARWKTESEANIKNFDKKLAFEETHKSERERRAMS